MQNYNIREALAILVLHTMVDVHSYVQEVWSFLHSEYTMKIGQDFLDISSTKDQVRAQE